MDGDAAWLAARFDELSKRYPALSLVVVMRPDDIDRVPHEAPDEHSVYSVVRGKYEWQCFAPDPVVVRDFEKDGDEFEVVSIPKPWLSFPFWHYSRGGETWKHGIWEMWLHRRFSFDPQKDDSSQELTDNIECLNAYCSLLEVAASLLFKNPMAREQWFFKDYCMPYPWENRKFESAGPWLLYLAECYPGQEVLYSPMVRVIHDIGVTSVRVLREMMRVENALPQQKLPESDASRPEEASLPETALKAIVAGGLAGVLNEAGKVPAAQRHSRAMMEMLANDTRYYWWSAEDWVVHLKSSKPTILATDAWDHIKRWREENKRERLGE
jgi:hypothetical protein